MGSVYQFYFPPYQHYVFSALKPEKFSENVLASHSFCSSGRSASVSGSGGLSTCKRTSGMDELTDGMVE